MIPSVSSPAALPERLTARSSDLLAVALACVAVGCLFGLILLAELVFGIDHYDLVRDPNAIAGQPTYFGAVSHVGIVFWCIAAVVSLQAFAVCREARRGRSAARCSGAASSPPISRR